VGGAQAQGVRRRPRAADPPYAPLVKYETYAISRIKGAIIDEPRAIDWIPRSVRFEARVLQLRAKMQDIR
jgi:hypothetical protein